MLVLSILLYVSKTWTLLASNMKAIESFHMKCQRRMLGIRWHDFVRNSEISLSTGLTPVSDQITRGRNAILRHVANLPDNIPAHQAMLRGARTSVACWTGSRVPYRRQSPSVGRWSSPIAVQVQ